MSNGRKIFRFLKWIENLKEIYYHIIYNSPTLINLLKAFKSLSSFFYHLFDNILWASNLGLVSEYLIGDIKIKNIKNIFSLLRNILKIIADFIKFKHFYCLEKQNENKIEMLNEKYNRDNKDIFDNLLKDTFEIRKKLRAKQFDLIHSCLRVCMLLSSLRLEPFYSNLHPIFIGICGSIHSIIALYKTLQDPELNEEEKLKETKNKEKYENGNFKKLKRASSSLSMLVGQSDYNNNPKLKENFYSEDFFKDYYIDFNKDFPMDPKSVLKSKKNK